MFFKKNVSSVNLNLRQYSVSRMVCVGVGLSDKIKYQLLASDSTTHGKNQ